MPDDNEYIGGVLWFGFAVFTGMYGLECFVAYGEMARLGLAVGWRLGGPYILAGLGSGIIGTLFEINKRRKRWQ